MDPSTSTVPENYSAYVKLCERNKIRPLDKPGFEVYLDMFLDNVSLTPRTEREIQIQRFLARVGLGSDSATKPANAGDVNIEPTGGKTPLGITGPPVSRPTALTNVDALSVFKSPIRLNIVAGAIDGLDPNRTLEAVGRMPSELIQGGQLFVIHRDSADQMSDFRVDIGSANDLLSYPGRPTRTASGDLSVQVQGIGTFIFPFTEKLYEEAGIFIEQVTGNKSDLPKLIRPASINPKTQWPHLGQMLRNIERD